MRATTTAPKTMGLDTYALAILVHDDGGVSLDVLLLADGGVGNTVQVNDLNVSGIGIVSGKLVPNRCKLLAVTTPRRME